MSRSRSRAGAESWDSPGSPSACLISSLCWTPLLRPLGSCPTLPWTSLRIFSSETNPNKLNGCLWEATQLRGLFSFQATHRHTHRHTHARTGTTCMHADTYVCACVLTYMHTRTHIHTETYTHTSTPTAPAPLSPPDLLIQSGSQFHIKRIVCDVSPIAPRENPQERIHDRSKGTTAACTSVCLSILFVSNQKRAHRFERSPYPYKPPNWACGRCGPPEFRRSRKLVLLSLSTASRRPPLHVIG